MVKFFIICYSSEIKREYNSVEARNTNSSTFTPSEIQDIIHKRNVDKLLGDTKSTYNPKISKFSNKSRYTRKTLLQIRKAKPKTK